MNLPPPDLLAQALGNVDAVATDRYPHWEVLIQRAREANLLGTLASRIVQRALLEAVPAPPRAHLVAARIRFEAQRRAVRREVRELAKVLVPLGVPVILLKGAAYLYAGLDAAEGRFFSDIDILVPRARLLDVESALMQAGFVTVHHRPYDQRYYRQWMHELPPLQHVKRMTSLDVHHAIAPPTSRAHPDSSLLLRDAVPLTAQSGFAVLAPADMVIHCATHLFLDEAFSHGPRDLVDFDALLRQFGRDPEFWPRLVARASELDLARPLYYALHWTSRIHRTPVPASTLDEAARYAPAAPLRTLMHRLLAPALRPTSARASTRWARRALYVRGHWLKMPPHLLAWHLTVKALRRDA